MKNRASPRGGSAARDLISTRALLLSALALATCVSGTAVANPLHDAVGAPDQLTLSGSFRSRVDAIDGQFRPNVVEDDSLWSLRTSVFAEYDTGPVRIGAELIDARAYGQSEDSSVGTGEVNALELSQVYVALDLGTAFGQGSETTLQAGRFTYHVGAGRLAARHKFRSSVNAFTGVNFGWRGANGDELVGLWSMAHRRRPDDEGVLDNEVEWDLANTDLQFYGANFTKANIIEGGGVALYAFGLNERDSDTRPTRNRRLFTPGARIFREPGEGAFDFDIEAAYQFGKVRASSSAADETDLDVSAYFVHAEVGKRLPGAWSPRVALFFDHGSGDDADPDSYGRFDSLFGSNRGDFGPTSLFGALSRANIVSGGAVIEVEPNDRWDGHVSYRQLWLDEATDSFASTKVRDAAGGSGTYAGSQVEARMRYWLMPEIARFEVGAAYLAKGSFLEDAPNAPATGDTRYAYADLTFTF